MLMLKYDYEKKKDNSQLIKLYAEKLIENTEKDKEEEQEEE